MAAIAAVAGGLEANFTFESAVRRVTELFQKGVDVVRVQSTDPAEMKTLSFGKTCEPFPVKVEMVRGSVPSHDPYRLRQKVDETQRLRLTPTNRRIAVRGGVARKDTFVAVAGRSCRGRGVLFAARVSERFKRGSRGQDSLRRFRGSAHLELQPASERDANKPLQETFSIHVLMYFPHGAMQPPNLIGSPPGNTEKTPLMLRLSPDGAGNEAVTTLRCGLLPGTAKRRGP